MILIKAENRELTLSISINQRNPSHEPEDPRHGVLLGTDFRHAVEFSRSGRARTPGLPAFVRGGSRCYALLSIGRYPGGFDRLAFRPARRREDTTPSCAPVQAPLWCGRSAWCNRDPLPGLSLQGVDWITPAFRLRGRGTSRSPPSDPGAGRSRAPPAARPA